jgi:hypothetical protein
MKKTTLIAYSALLLALATSIATRADEGQAQAAFEKLKSLAGNWEGTGHGEGEAEGEGTFDATHIFRIASAGTVVMETMNPGADGEMINMYHLDGDALRVTHYCAGGNQPAMLLDQARSTADKLYFEFIGGTNMDPEVDHHIHSIEIDLLGPDKIQSVYGSYGGGESAGAMSFALERN